MDFNSPLVKLTDSETIRENFQGLKEQMGRRRGVGKILPPAKKSAIIKAIQDKKSNVDIVRELHCAARTVRKLRENYESGDLQ